ncbi:MAG: hypothetical protein WCK63_05015 [Betaproteobacteria bacterium]
MSKNSFHASREAFIKALHDYQSATLEMNQALQRLTQHNHALYQPLKVVVHSTTSLLSPNCR